MLNTHTTVSDQKLGQNLQLFNNVLNINKLPSHSLKFTENSYTRQQCGITGTPYISVVE